VGIDGYYLIRKLFGMNDYAVHIIIDNDTEKLKTAYISQLQSVCYHAVFVVVIFDGNDVPGKAATYETRASRTTNTENELSGKG
jgi:hypothetical protein